MYDTQIRTKAHKEKEEEEEEKINKSEINLKEEY